MKLVRVAVAVAVLGLGGVAVAALPTPKAIVQPAAAVARELVAPAPRYRTVTHTIAEGDTAGSVLRAMGGPTEELLAAAGSALNRLSIGDRIHLDFEDGAPASDAAGGASTLEGRPWRLRLDRDDPEIVELSWNGKKYVSSARPIPFTIESGARTLTINSSLWEAAADAGLRPPQIVELAEIFEYDIDFNTELVKGATIRAVGDTLTDDLGNKRFGGIRAAVLVNGKKTWTAVRFVMKDGSVGWFAPDGTGRRRPFLRSPLAFSRVTSSFNLARYHPVLKRARPHLGVDFGAPTGTPVRAVADGVVKIAGRHGGHGNFIELDHEGPYATSYSHLSSILVKKGQTVNQGDLIGKVGSTGMSTGPHLHYQFFVNGQYKNPMTVDLPMTGSLPDAERDAFFAVRDEVMPLLTAPSEGATVAASEGDAVPVSE
ncbi:MAG: peptidoglycan DD-metalloendopeptidase family protein [Myxococcota bacterium]